MDVSIWEILGIEPTTDKKAIKKAYAHKLKQLDMEQEAETFQQLKTAFDAAMKGESPKNPQIIVEFTSQPFGQPSALDDAVFEQLCFNEDLIGLKDFLERTNEALSIDDYEYQRRKVHHFLYEQCFYLSEEISDLLLEFFALSNQDDAIYGQDLTGRLHHRPKFPFNGIIWRDEFEHRLYFRQRFDLFSQLTIDVSNDEWQEKLANCRKRVSADPTLDYLELCYWLQQDFRMNNRSLDEKISDLFSRLESTEILPSEISFLRNYRLVLLSEEVVDLGDEDGFWTFQQTPSMPKDLYCLLTGYLAYQLEEYPNAGKQWHGLIAKKGIDLFQETELRRLMTENAIDYSLYTYGKNIHLHIEYQQLEQLVSQADCFDDPKVWKEYLRSCELSQQKLAERKLVIQRFLIDQQGYQYLSPNILDYLCQYFSWHTKEDFSEKMEEQDIFLLMREVPRFSFEVCQKLLPKQRKIYLHARYHLYLILNYCHWNEQYWNQQLQLCENLYPEDLEVEMLKIWREIQTDFKAVQMKTDLLEPLSAFEEHSEHLGYQFLLQYQQFLKKRPTQIASDITVKRPSVVPVKIFHLMMGHLCYRLGSYNLSYAHWYPIVIYETALLTDQELKIFKKYNFEKVSCFLFAGTHQQYIDQENAAYSLLKNGRLIKRRHEEKNAGLAIILLIWICLGFFKMAGHQISSENRSSIHSDDVTQVNRSVRSQSWGPLRSSHKIENRYCYYMYGPDNDTKERQWFFEQDSTLPEKRQNELVDLGGKQQGRWAVPLFEILHYPQKDGSILHLVTRNGGKVLDYLATREHQLTEVYSGELVSDQLLIKEAQKRVERSPYGLSNYILKHYFLERAEEDQEKEAFLMQQPEAYQKLLTEAQKNPVEIVDSQTELMVRRLDAGCAVLFLDYDNGISYDGTWMELIFDDQDQLIDITSNRSDDGLPKKWSELADNPNYEDITEHYVSMVNGQ